MINIDDSRNTYEYKNIFKILPELADKSFKKDGQKWKKSKRKFSVYIQSKQTMDFI